MMIVMSMKRRRRATIKKKHLKFLSVIVHVPCHWSAVGPCGTVRRECMAGQVLRIREVKREFLETEGGVWVGVGDCGCFTEPKEVSRNRRGTAHPRGERESRETWGGECSRNRKVSSWI